MLAERVLSPLSSDRHFFQFFCLNSQNKTKNDRQYNCGSGEENRGAGWGFKSILRERYEPYGYFLEQHILDLYGKHGTIIK